MKIRLMKKKIISLVLLIVFTFTILIPSFASDNVTVENEILSEDDVITSITEGENLENEEIPLEVSEKEDIISEIVITNNEETKIEDTILQAESEIETSSNTDTNTTIDTEIIIEQEINELEIEIKTVSYDSQPTSIEEVQAVIDSYTSLPWYEAVKPHWQYKVDDSLMPFGYYCDLIESDENFGAEYYTFFIRPATRAITILPPGSTSADLQTAIDSATSGDTIEISSDMTFLQEVTIPTGKAITIQSTSGNNWTLTQTIASTRHFRVFGTLNLQNIILDGSGIGGGVTVDSIGTFNMNSNTTIQNCYGADGGAVRVFGIFNMYNGLLTNNVATNHGGAISINPSGTVNMYGGTITDNSTPQGGGIYAYGTFNMYNGTITNNTSSSTRWWNIY